MVFKFKAKKHFLDKTCFPVSMSSVAHLFVIGCGRAVLLQSFKCCTNVSASPAHHRNHHDHHNLHDDGNHHDYGNHEVCHNYHDFDPNPPLHHDHLPACLIIVIVITAIINIVIKIIIITISINAIQT